MMQKTANAVAFESKFGNVATAFQLNHYIS